MTPTAKQIQAISAIMHFKTVLLTGGVRSGKTFSILFSIPWLIRKHATENCVLCAKTLKNIERNILLPLREIYGAEFVGSIIDKQDVRLFGKLFWCIAFNDNSSADKLQGTSIGLAILDEIVLCPKSFYEMLQTRLDKPFSQMLATCNPDSPNHYIKTDLIDNAEIRDKFVQHWTLYDNKQHLSPDVIRTFENAFSRSPTFYRRMILGKWCNTDGLAVYNFDRSKHYKLPSEIDINKYIRLGHTIIFSVDPANANDMTGGCLSLFGYNDDCIVLPRFGHNPKTSKQLSNVEQVGLIKRYIDDLYADERFRICDLENCDKIMIVDCAAADMYIQLTYVFEPLGWQVLKMTKKDIKRTLDIENNAFAKNKILIINDDDRGIYDYTLETYTYNDPLINELESVRLIDIKTPTGTKIGLNPEDPNDTFDSLRYAIAYYFKVEDMTDD